MLCTICRAFISSQVLNKESLARDQFIPHHPTCISFKESIDQGCYACTRLWDRLTPNRKTVISDLIQSQSQIGSDDALSGPDSSGNRITASQLLDDIYGQNARDSIWLFAIREGVTQSGRICWAWLPTFVIQSFNVDTMRNPRLMKLSQRTNSPETLSLARNWISDCMENHPQCMIKGGDGFYPPRLLDCELTEAFNRTLTDCRLVETSKDVVCGPYMTLSHCWGSAECMKLTTSNRAQFLHKVSFSALPRLYQDALAVVRQLGVRYLWIDSICIIQQGDKWADWKRHVSLIGDIYSNSFCNISATTARDCHQTMFNNREPSFLLPEVVTNESGSFLVSDHDVWSSEVSGALLNTRGWVLQERLMARRILHFSTHQLFWECKNKEAAEAYPDGLPRGITGPVEMRFKNLIPGDGTEDHEGLLGYKAWDRIVRKYTACNLTFSSDKLPAISSIAKAMRLVLQDQYLGGLWRRYLEHQLLWENNIHAPERPDVTTFHPKPTERYCCPSWSWASVHTEINPGSIDKSSEILIKALETHLEYETEDDTGPIRSGWLRLRGVLKRLSLAPYSSSHVPRSSSHNWDVHINGIHVSEETEHVFPAQQPQIRLDTFHEDFSKENLEASLYCMPAKVSRGSGYIHVLLFELLDLEKAIFRRIGIAQGWGEAVRKKILTRSGNEATLPCEDFREGLHCIQVI